MDQIWPIEITIIQFLQSLGDWIVEPMRMITFLGSEQFFIIVLPVILWCVDYGLGLRIGLILVSSGQIFCMLKVALHSPRPFWFSANIQAYSLETSFGMPSGHAMNVMSIFGLFAAGVKRKWVTWVCAIAIFLVGLSRLFLGMHFISDVLAGWLLGGLLLFCFIRFGNKLTGWFLKQSIRNQYLIVILSAFFWLVLSYLPYFSATDWQIPPEWVQNAIRYGENARPDPYSISGIYTNVGIWLGMGLGGVWLHHRGGFNANGTGMQQLIRFVIGLIGTVILWMGLDKIFPDGSSLLALAFRLVRYTLVGFWVTGGAPEIFIRIKAAGRALITD